MDWKEAVNHNLWKNHKIGDEYSMINRDGSRAGTWKIAYYPLLGTYKGDADSREWIKFNEIKVLIERPLDKGIDFREISIRYLEKIV